MLFPESIPIALKVAFVVPAAMVFIHWADSEALYFTKIGLLVVAVPVAEAVPKV